MLIKNLSIFQTFLVLITFALIFSGCKSPVSVSVDDSTENVDDLNEPVISSNQEILSNLGFNLEKPAPLNENGVIISGTMNPLGDLVSNLFTQYELFQVGVGVSSFGRYFAVEQDLSSLALTDLANYQTTESGPAADWLSLPKKSVAGDINGDGLEEIITAVFRGSDNHILLKVSKPDGTLTTKDLGTWNFVADFGERLWLHDDYFMRDFTAGDFNNDGLTDFALSCMTGVLILDHNLEVVGSFEIEMSTPDNTEGRMVRVEAGDLNGDNFADLVVVNGRRVAGRLYAGGGLGKYYIFKGGTGGLGIPELYQPTGGNSSALYNFVELEGVLQGNTVFYSSGEIIIADYDGNGINEIVLAGMQDLGQDDDSADGWDAFLYPAASIWDPYNEQSGSFISTYPVADYQFPLFANNNVGHHPRNFYIPQIVVGRFDGGLKDMFSVMDVIFSINTTDMVFEISSDQVYPSHNNESANDMAYDLAVAGDLTGNGCDELIFMKFGPNHLPWVSDLGNWPRNNQIDNFVIWGKTADNVFAKLKDISVTSTNQFPTLAIANVDNDSLVVKYNRRELQFSQPEILAVLASPPYQANPPMDIGNSSTTYTITSGTEISEGIKNGFNVSVTAGLEASIDAGIEWIGGGRKLSVENEFAWGYGNSFSNSLDYGYTAAAGTDMVIVAAIPIDVYIYDVLSAPDPSDIGTAYTINIPREPLEKFVEVGTYNDLVPPDQKIPNDILMHTIGNPGSYYTKLEMETIRDSSNEGFFYSGSAKPVAQGAGATTQISYAADQSDFNSYEYNLTAGYEENLKVLVFAISYGAGYSYGYSFEHIVSNGFAIEGVVGNYTNTNDWLNNDFGWGLMMIPKHFGNQDFNLVTYWVE